MREKTTGNQMDFYNTFIQTSSKMNLCILLRILHEKIQKVENNGGWGGGVFYNTLSHLFFFATLNKEQKSSYFQLCRRLNGKMLVLGFLYSKSTTVVQQKNVKNPTCQTIAFFAKYYKHKYPKNCPLKIACSRL